MSTTHDGMDGRSGSTQHPGYDLSGGSGVPSEGPQMGVILGTLLHTYRYHTPYIHVYIYTPYSGVGTYTWAYTHRGSGMDYRWSGLPIHYTLSGT